MALPRALILLMSGYLVAVFAIAPVASAGSYVQFRQVSDWDAEETFLIGSPAPRTTASEEQESRPACVDVLTGSSSRVALGLYVLPGTGAAVWGPISAGAVVYASNCAQFAASMFPKMSTSDLLWGGRTTPMVRMSYLP